MRFGVSWVPDDVRGLGPLAAATEAAGFDVIGIPDSHFSAYREMVVCLTLVATHTTSVRLGPLVSNPASRHPLVLAQTLVTLQELTGGRCFAGLGRGDDLHLMGLEVPGLEALRTSAAELRRLTAGETVRRGEVELRLDLPPHATPVYLPGDGPRGLRLAGEVADGVVIGFGLTPEAIAAARGWIAEGLGRGGRPAPGLEVWFRCNCLVLDGAGETPERVEAAVAGTGHTVFKGSLAAKGVPEDLHDAVRALVAGYQLREHFRPGPDNPNARLARRLGLVDYLTRRFALVGTAEQCVSRLRELRAAGVERLMLRPMNQDRRLFLEAWQGDILPRLRAP